MNTAQAIVELAAGDLSEIEKLPQRAVEVMIRSTEAWLDGLAASSPVAAACPTVRGPLAWQLRGHLRQCPEMLLACGASDSFQPAIQEATAPIVPQPAPARMAPQQLGALPRVLCSAFWSRLGRRVRLGGRRRRD